MEVENVEIKDEKQTELPFDQKEIGEDKPLLVPKKVLITGYSVKEIKKKKGEGMLKILEVITKHPDKGDEPLIISKAKYERGGNLKIDGLWLHFDDEDKLQFRCPVAFLLRYLNVGKIVDLVGKELDTTPEEEGYLVFKAY